MVDSTPGLPFFRCLSAHPKAFTFAVGLAVLAVSALFCWFRRAKTESKPTLTVAILSKEALVELLKTIRDRHSEASNSLRRVARKKRRQFERGSDEYTQCILHYNEKARTLIREVSKTVIREQETTEMLVMASCNFYEGDEDVDEAKSKLSVVINDVNTPRGLDLYRTKEIFVFCRDKSREILDDSYCDFVVRNIALEDEIWERFGFEMEEIERAFDRFRRELKALETQLHLHGRRSFSASLPHDDGSEAV